MSETPTRDEFDAWKDNPVTRFVLAGHEKLAERQLAAFQHDAWTCAPKPEAFEALLIYRERCKARVEAYTDLANVSFEDAYGANEIEPPTKDSA